MGGLAYQALAAAIDARRYPPLGRLVDVNVLAQAYVNRSLAYGSLGRSEEAEADRAKACELGLVEVC